jgi:hypothetical protein
MTSNQELLELIEFARSQGATVEVGRDTQAWEDEGRFLVETVRVSGVPGIGSFPMAALAAAEALRRFMASSAR